MLCILSISSMQTKIEQDTRKTGQVIPQVNVNAKNEDAELLLQ